MGQRCCVTCTPRPCLVLCNVFSTDWCVHFLDADYKTRIGPWLLFDSREDFEAKVLTWGHVSERGMEEYRHDLNRTTFSTVRLHLTEGERAGLVDRGRGWPWNGHQLLYMKAAGTYPPARLRK